MHLIGNVCGKAFGKIGAFIVKALRKKIGAFIDLLALDSV